MAIDSSPQFDLTINGYDVDPALARAVRDVEYDILDGAISTLKLNISNVDFKISDTKIIRPGNLIKVFAGYGAERRLIGGARIHEVNTDDPDNGVPRIEAVGYTGDFLMTKNSPAPRAEGQPFTKKPRKKRDNDGRTWFEGAMYSDAIRDKARSYGFRVDVDDTPAHIVGPLGIFQPAGMTDYQFITAIANDLRWLFWVSADEQTETWILHFKDPDTTSGIQDRKYDFARNKGDQTTCFAPQFSEFDQGPTSLQVQFLNPKTKKLETISVEADATFAEDPNEYFGVPQEEPLIRPPNKPQTGPEVTLAFGGSSVVTQADREFGSVAEAKTWAQSWFNAHARDYIRAEWKTKGPGSETLTARQVHSLSGVGSRYSGDYYLDNVTQRWSAGGGHVVVCKGTKISNSQG